MIKSINYIRDYGIFQRFEDSEGRLPVFARRNLIYGWNYSGKTTLSRIFRSLEKEELHDDFADGSFSLTLNDGTTVTEANLDAVEFPIRVFNSDYVKENLIWSEGVDPIFILGEKSIELQDRLDLIDGWLDRRRQFVSRLESRRQTIQDELDTEGTRTARRIRTDLNKTPFRRSPHLTDVVRNLGKDFAEFILSEKTEAEARSVLAAEKRDEVEVHEEFELKEVLKYQTFEGILRRTPTQDIVDRLREDTEVEGWVEEGLPLHKDSERCHFCYQPLPPDCLPRLRRHFSEEYEDLKEDVIELIGELEVAKIELDLADEAKVYPDLRSEYVELRNECLLVIESANGAIDDLIERLREKLAHPDQEPELTWEEKTEPFDALNAKLRELNSVIKRHNKRCRNFKSARANAQRRLVRHEVASYMEEVDYYERLKAKDDLARREHRWRTRIDSLERERSELELQFSEEFRGADRVNHFMTLYFSARDMRVSVTDGNKYVLQRDGHRAKNLSEGERTAIAFSYFCASLEERDTAVEQSLIYIDDPVSSLDSNHVFNTFGIIRAIGSECRQLFVSTHNYQFFRLCKQGSFFQERVKRGNRASWYLLRRTVEGSSELLDLPETLRKYNSEYHYLFDLVYSFYKKPEEFRYLIGLMPNIVRRLLETYSSFRIPNTAMNLYQRLERLIPEDEESRNQIYSYANHGSHSDSMGYGRDFPQSSESYEVVAKVLDVLKSNDDLHFEGMMALLED